jgi:putative ABC transport system permease protein
MSGFRGFESLRGGVVVGFITLAWRNANGNRFRSWVVFVCALLMAGFAVLATIVIGGAQTSLNLALNRLGADIIVVPTGTEHAMENAFLMGVPVAAWMPEANVDRIAAVPGVETISPQLFLSTLRGASCCSVPEMFLIGYEPETDFTLRPWLEEHLEEGLSLGEAVGGAFVYVPQDPGYISVYGYEINLAGTLEQTGTGLDQSMFFTFDTAYDIARLSPELAVEDLEIPDDSVSAAMVKTARGADPAEVARCIQEDLPTVTAVESTNLFRSQRVQIMSLLRSVLALLGVAWVLFVTLIGLVFSIAINERRQEIGVLRALGLPRRFVLESLLSEGVILGLAGSVVGVGLSIFGVYLFRHLIIMTMGVPFKIPSPFQLFLLAAGALVVTLVSVTLGALAPSLRISLMDPATAMRK